MSQSACVFVSPTGARYRVVDADLLKILDAPLRNDGEFDMRTVAGRKAAAVVEQMGALDYAAMMSGKELYDYIDGVR